MSTRTIGELGPRAMGQGLNSAFTSECPIEPMLAQLLFKVLLEERPVLGDLRIIPRPATSASLGNLIEMPILGPSLGLLNQRVRECCLATCVFKSHVGDSDEH